MNLHIRQYLKKKDLKKSSTFVSLTRTFNLFSSSTRFLAQTSPANHPLFRLLPNCFNASRRVACWHNPEVLQHTPYCEVRLPSSAHINQVPHLLSQSLAKRMAASQKTFNRFISGPCTLSLSTTSLYKSIIFKSFSTSPTSLHSLIMALDASLLETLESIFLLGGHRAMTLRHFTVPNLALGLSFTPSPPFPCKSLLPPHDIFTTHLLDLSPVVAFRAVLQIGLSVALPGRMTIGALQVHPRHVVS